MDNEFLQDPAMIQEFLVESEELLQGMDQDMVALESAPRDADLLNRIFRALHTIKGTAGFLGLEAVVRLSHRAEDVLNGLRRGEIELTRRVMDALLTARDELGKMLQDIRGGGLRQYDLDPLLHELQAAQHTVAVPPAQFESPAKEVPASEPLAKKASAVTPQTKGQPIPSAAAEIAEPHPDSEASQKSAEIVAEKKNAAVPANDAGARQQRPAESHCAGDQTMRVDVRKLDELINLIGELVLERNRLVQLARDSAARRLAADVLDSYLAESTARLSFITEELQAAGLRTRMIPIDAVFRKFPRLVRDVGKSLNKEVDLVLAGQDTELDKTMVELIGDPLVHLVRNSLDHGIEAPEVRAQLGKPRHGTIRLEARQEGDQIVISVSDDGRGLDPDRIGRKAVEKGLVTPERLRTLSPREILDFIFLPGFSTVEKASDLSGRGVGMDVVRSNLKKLNGAVHLESRVGQRTTVHLRLPLTLAILPVLLVSVAEEVYALPLRSVIETAQIQPRDVHTVEGKEVLCLRGETLPLLRLARMFQVGVVKEDDTVSKVVVLGVADRRIALLVDHLLGEESTVVKPLGSYLQQCPALAGATISGDGRVRLVVDPAGLLATAESLAKSLARGACA